jgi:hypothetical protein
LKAVTDRVLNFYRQNEVVLSIFGFAAGFVFDLGTLGRIDDLFNLIQQAIYLTILGTLLLLEIKITTGRVKLPERFRKIWNYHNLLVHFLFGSLLSAYTIFYYTSASAITGLLYILLLAGLMLANEIPHFKRMGLPVRVILYNICLLSYFAFFYPIVFGHVGALPFWLGFLTSALVVGLIWKANFQGEMQGVLKNHVALPAVLIHLLFLLGYYFNFIPPVPVAVKKIGIYYEVKKEDGKYLGLHQRPNWKFWEKGSQDFRARPGDKVNVLLSVFSPAHFEDKVYLKWFYDGHLEDTIPLSILGGREQGFRGYGTKQFYKLGPWQVLVETSDGREVGSIRFTISEDNSIEAREFKIDSY